MEKNAIKTIFKLAPCGLALLFTACDGPSLQQQSKTEQIVIEEPKIETKSNNIQFVKDYVFPEYPTVKVGRMLEGYQYFSSPKWDEYTTSQGERIVRFTADYKAPQDHWSRDIYAIKGSIEFYFAIAESQYGMEYVELQKFIPYLYEKVEKCNRQDEHKHGKEDFEWHECYDWGEGDVAGYKYRRIKENYPLY